MFIHFDISRRMHATSPASPSPARTPGPTANSVPASRPATNAAPSALPPGALGGPAHADADADAITGFVGCEHASARFAPHGVLSGANTNEIVRTLGQLQGLFADEAARVALPAERVVYKVQTHLPVPDGTPGALFFGVTFIEAGLVGDEFFMTRGHLHAKREAAEYYWGIEGEGLLLLRDPEGRCRAELIRPGSLHYVPGHTAHRTVNTGCGTLVFGACWPADAGHDYDTIAREGFGVRAMRRRDDGVVVLIPDANLNPPGAA